MRIPLRLPLLLAGLLPVACSTPDVSDAVGPAAFVRDHYASIQVGADWEELRHDFTRDALIVRPETEDPGSFAVDGVENFFQEMGPVIDSMQSFRIEPQGMRSWVYDRIASVITYVEVESVDSEGEVSGFTAVDQFSLALESDGSWRITHLLYQREADGWQPPRNNRARPFTRGGFEVDVDAWLHSN